MPVLRPVTPLPSYAPPPSGPKLTFNSLVGTGANGDDDVPLKTTDQQSERTGSWAAGLCECFSYPYSCLSACFCEPCVVAQVLNIGAGGRKNLCLATGAALIFFTILMVVLQNLPDEGSMVVGGLISAGLSLFTLAVLLYAKSKVRERENIKGSPVGDCCASFFCAPCSLCQILNQYPPYRGFWASYEVLDTTSEV